MAEGNDHEKQWIISIQKQVDNLNSLREKQKEKKNPGFKERPPKIFRIPAQQLVTRQKHHAFNAQTVHLGLLHGQRFKKLEGKSTARASERTEKEEDMLVKTAVAFLEDLHGDVTWDKICEKVVPGILVRKQYDMRHSDIISEELVRYALTLDAIFLASFLSKHLLDPSENLFKSSVPIISKEALTFHSEAANDIVKLNNQIPLELIKNVFEIGLENKSGGTESQNAEGNAAGKAESVLKEICCKMVGLVSNELPGFLKNEESTSELKKMPFHECAHLLDCLCSVMRKESSKGETQTLSAKAKMWFYPSVITFMKHFARCCSKREHETGKHSLISIYTATKLKENGIDFRGRASKCVGGTFDLVPKFKKGFLKATLEIPSFAITTRTEVFWRNMVAYETQVATVDGEGAQFIFFLKLMDELINEEKDVSVMRQGKHPVIKKNMLSTDREAADLFNSVVQHCIVEESSEWTALRAEIHKFYHRYGRLMVLEFVNTYFSKPWLVISVMAATVLLILTFLQTLYTLMAYYNV